MHHQREPSRWRKAAVQAVITALGGLASLPGGMHVLRLQALREVAPQAIIDPGRPV